MWFISYENLKAARKPVIEMGSSNFKTCTFIHDLSLFIILKK